MSSNSTAVLAARKEGISIEELPQALSVIDCEKRRGVSRYYAYVIEITRKNREKYHIYRRYRQFHKMTQRLEERFPIEAGSIRASDRILPQLPGKKYIGRSSVRNVADLRMPYLDDFLKRLYAMSDKIRYDSIVLGFLKPNNEDLDRPYHKSITYPGRTNGTRDGSTSPPERPKPPRLLRPTRSNPPNIPLPVPSIHVTSPGKTPPARPTPPRLSPPRLSPKPVAAKPKPLPKPIAKGPRAKVLYDYVSQYEDEISLRVGSIVALLRKLEGSWYEGRVNGDVGLVPGNYLEIIEALPDDEDEDSSEETDEWDDEEDDSIGQVICYYKSKEIKIDLETELIKRPTYKKLMFAIRGQLKDSKITINYKDSSGDLIEIVDDNDLQIMKDQLRGRASDQKTNLAPWKLYISKSGDTAVYNTHPYK